MLSLQDAVVPILSLPTPAALVDLQGALLARAEPSDAFRQAQEVAGRFHAYLSELESKVGARSYSELASRLDIGAVGALWIGALYHATQRISPFLEIGYHYSTYQNDFKDKSIQGVQVLLGIRFTVWGKNKSIFDEY